MRFAATAVCAVLALGTVQTAGAAEADEGGRWSVGVSAGTLGISPEVGYRFNKFAGVRVNGGFFSFDHTDDDGEIEYDTRLKLNSVGALADLYPFGGSFRISAGLRSSSNKFSGVGTPIDDVEMGDELYTPAQIGVLRGDVRFKKLAPTVTMGRAGKFANGFAFGVEAGVMLQSSAKVRVAASGGTLSSDPLFLDSLEEWRADKEDKAGDYKVWPIVQVHFLYRF